MTGLRVISTALAIALLAGPAVAAIEACDRVTHVSHGGSDAHRDLGDGKVMWIDWWAQEGVFKDVWLANCETGQALSLRTWEERIKERHVIDRTERAVEKIDRQAEAPAFFTIERVAGIIRKDGVDLTVDIYSDEFCACAAAYPELRRDKTAFEEVPS
ncbi:MAG: hypothetical protein AAF340_05780 [Pseudomonadota bacterium]